MQPSRISRRRRTQALIATAGSLAILGAMSTLSASAHDLGGSGALAPSPRTATTSTGAVTIPTNMRLYQKRTSMLGTHRWYQQVRNGHVVVGGWYAVHVFDDGRLKVWDGRRTVRHVNALSPDVSVARATITASRAASATAAQVNDSELMVLPSDDGAARLVWGVTTATNEGVTVGYVDSVTGEIVKRVVLSRDMSSEGAHTGSTIASALATGHGRVFDPNPVVALQRENLRDHNDANSAVPNAAYRSVTLSRLNGNHTLVGKWVRIVNSKRASSSTDNYFFRRHSDFFEQVNAYYAVDAEQQYLQDLGFTDVNAESQKMQTDTIPDDNSFYDPSSDQITMGTGGVDDAEDPEVVWHEYGHAIQDDQVPNFGLSEQAGAIGEGFGDYMAVTMSQARVPNGTVKTPTACVMDWDATSYTTTTPHCLRRTDGNKHFPDDLDGEVHDDGEIWSRALWDMNRDLGRDEATSIVIEAQFMMNPVITMPQAARIIVKTAKTVYGDDAAATTRQAFVDRGILLPLA